MLNKTNFNSFLIFIRLFSIILSIIGVSMILPLLVAFFYKETSVISSFLIPFSVSLIFGITGLFSIKKTPFQLGTRTVFFFVSFSWIVISVFGAVPLYLSGFFPSFLDAFFESVSGFSTTGATVLAEIDSLPRSINLWRMEMHWLGGMGIIALTTAILPLLGTDGFQLVKAESTGPEKGKITPKMANTAKALWTIYLFLTILQTVLLLFCKMDFVDALGHAFSTLGTGGFSSKTASLQGFNSLSAEIVCTIFMFLAGVNFSLYYFLITKKFDQIKKNSELKAYAIIFFTVILLLTFTLIEFYGGFGKALRYASFQVASIMSTTGFATADFMAWPSSSQFLLFLLFLIGACSGSTAGGLKVIRVVILSKAAKVQMLKMLHPHGIFSVRINKENCRNDLVMNVAAFTFVYALLTLITTFIGTLGGLEVFQAFTASLSMLGNIGPAFGPFFDYGWIPSFVKFWYCFMMIAGRLEIYNLIIFFIADFWKK